MRRRRISARRSSTAPKAKIQGIRVCKAAILDLLVHAGDHHLRPGDDAPEHAG